MSTGIISASRKRIAVSAGYSAAVLADNPLAYYKMDELSGTDMLDSSPNGHHGTYNNNPGLGGVSLLPHGEGKSATFNGTNQYGVVPYDPWMVLTTFTIEAWIKPGAVTGADRGIAGRWSGSGTRPWAFEISSTGKLRAFSSSSGADISGTTTLVVGTAYHVAAAVTPGTCTLYLNGVQQAKDTSWPQASPSTLSLTIGSIGLLGWFSGSLDEVALYGSALTAAQLAAHVSAA